MNARGEVEPMAEVQAVICGSVIHSKASKTLREALWEAASMKVLSWAMR